MPQHLHALALVVRDYDEAIDWYTRVLGFTLVEDTPMDDGKRWVRVAPRGSGETSLLLARATRAGQLASVGNQAGGRRPDRDSSARRPDTRRRKRYRAGNGHGTCRRLREGRQRRDAADSRPRILPKRAHALP